MRLEAEFTSEPFHGEGSPPEHALAARDAAVEAGLDTDFGPLGTLVRGDAKALLEALPRITQAALDGGATQVTLQVRQVAAADAGAAAEEGDRPGGPTEPEVVSAADQRDPTTTRAAEPHTTDGPVVAPHATGDPAGKLHAAGGPAGKPHATGGQAGKLHATGGQAGKPHATGDSADKSHTASGLAGKPRSTGDPAGKPHTAGSRAGGTNTTGGQAGGPNTAGSQAGESHGVDSAPSVELNDALARLIADVERELGAELGDLDRAGKQRAVRLLRERGAFGLRKSVSSVADALGVTRFTVYNYLNREAD